MIQDQLKTRVVGVDVEVDRTTCAVVDIRGNIIAQEKFFTRDYENIGDFVAFLTEEIMRLSEANGG